MLWIASLADLVDLLLSEWTLQTPQEKRKTLSMANLSWAKLLLSTGLVQSSAIVQQAASAVNVMVVVENSAHAVSGEEDLIEASAANIAVEIVEIAAVDSTTAKLQEL